MCKLLNGGVSDPLEFIAFRLDALVERVVVTPVGAIERVNRPCASDCRNEVLPGGVTVGRYERR